MTFVDDRIDQSNNRRTSLSTIGFLVDQATKAEKDGSVFVAASTECWPDMELQEAIEVLTDLEFTALLLQQLTSLVCPLLIISTGNLISLLLLNQLPRG